MSATTEGHFLPDPRPDRKRLSDATAVTERPSTARDASGLAPHPALTYHPHREAHHEHHRETT